MPTIQKTTATMNHYPIGKFFLQTILIPNAHSKKSADDWLKQNNYKHNYHRITTNFHRYLQTNPVKGSVYKTKKLKNGIELVYQKYT